MYIAPALPLALSTMKYHCIKVKFIISPTLTSALGNAPLVSNLSTTVHLHLALLRAGLAFLHGPYQARVIRQNSVLTFYLF